jgi:hypothetical protein
MATSTPKATFQFPKTPSEAVGKVVTGFGKAVGNELLSHMGSLGSSVASEFMVKNTGTAKSVASIQ